MRARVAANPTPTPTRTPTPTPTRTPTQAPRGVAPTLGALVALGGAVLERLPQETQLTLAVAAPTGVVRLGFG